MFYAAITVVPLVAGLVAGLATTSGRAPVGLAALCIALGMAGAIVTAFNPDERVENVAGSLAFSMGAAALAYFGWVGGRRASRRHA